MIELNGMIGIPPVHCSHRVPFHAVFLQQSDAAPCAVEVLTISVMHRFRPVNADADQEVVLSEKLAPLIGEQGAIGLQTVVNVPSVSVPLLQLQCACIIADGQKQGLAAMPGEENLGLRLSLYVLPNEFFQQCFVHAPLLLR